MGLLGRVGKTAVAAGAATAVVKRVQHRQRGRWSGQDGDQAAAPDATAPAAGQDAKLAQLKQLGELKNSGVLTDDEFQRQKNQILDG
ncbi:MAG TPA: SHOCT domain-containing protein [Pseudonocardiaceae bacterium]|jgi:hypothetical protein